MRKKLLVAVFAAAMVMTGCGQNAENADNAGNGVSFEQVQETVVEETVPSEEVAAEEATAEEAEATDAETSEGDVEDKYSVFTSASNEEVEAYAQKVVDATLAKDWDTIGDMIQYPIGGAENNSLCNNKEEFVKYANETGFDEEFFTTLSQWKVSDLWGNWQGACIDNGNIWFRDLSLDTPDFKIVSFMGLYEPEVAE